MLTSKQRAYIDYSLQNPTILDSQCARDLKIAKKTLSAWKHNEEFMTEYEKALKKQWAGYAKEAQKVIHQLLYSDRADVALNAAKYLLSSNGYDAPQNMNINADVTTIKVEIVDE